MIQSSHNDLPLMRNGNAGGPHLRVDEGKRPAQTAECDITFFVACYNEAENIIDTIETVVAAAQEVGCTYEVLIIDDASRDDSVKLIEAYQRQHPQLPIVLKKNPVNQGLARNFVDGSFLGRGKYYKLVCGDNVEPKERLVKILHLMGTADLVIPYHETCEGKSRSRVLISRTFTRIVNLLSGYRLRYYNGMAVYQRYHVMRWHSHSVGFGFQADLVTRLLDEGATHVEVSAPVRERVKGSSSALTLRNLVSVGHTLLEIYFRRLRRTLFLR